MLIVPIEVGLGVAHVSCVLYAGTASVARFMVCVLLQPLAVPLKLKVAHVLYKSKWSEVC